MRIAVCIKQVPGSTKVRMDPVTNTLVREGGQGVLNPFDSYAVELAVQLGETLGAETLAITMGIPEAEGLLRDACARGIGGGMLLTDRAFAGADTLATAYTLSLGVQKMGGADLILCGKMAVDGDTAQIGPELAEFLEMAHVTDVCAIEEVGAGFMVVRRLLDGVLQELEVKLPAVLTVAKELNQPRMPSIAGVRRSLTAPLVRCGAAQLGADPGRVGMEGSPTRVLSTFVPQREGAAIEIEGDAAAQAAGLAELLASLDLNGGKAWLN